MSDNQDTAFENEDFNFGDDFQFDGSENEEVIPNYGLNLESHQQACERLELEQRQHKLDVERAMLPERKRYAGCISFISISWLAFIGACVWNSGRQYLTISDSVLIALITTTTINVLGLFYIVARWLFPQKFNGDEGKHSDE